MRPEKRAICVGLAVSPVPTRPLLHKAWDLNGHKKRECAVINHHILTWRVQLVRSRRFGATNGKWHLNRECRRMVLIDWSLKTPSWTPIKEPLSDVDMGTSWICTVKGRSKILKHSITEASDRWAAWHKSPRHAAEDSASTACTDRWTGKQ